MRRALALAALALLALPAEARRPTCWHVCRKEVSARERARCRARCRALRREERRDARRRARGVDAPEQDKSASPVQRPR